MSTMTTRIWRAHALPPLTGGDLVAVILRRSTSYYNKLVEIERARLERFAEIRREFAPDLAALDAALAEVERLRGKLTAMHRRAQRAEGIADRYAEGRPQGAHGRSVGRALANYAAHRAIQQRDEAIAERDAARAEAQRERERADALQRCLGQRAPDEPETYA